MRRQPQRSTLFPTRRSSYLSDGGTVHQLLEVGLTFRDAGEAHRQPARRAVGFRRRDRKSTRLNSSHMSISYAVFCLKKKKPEHPIKSQIDKDSMVEDSRVIE